MAFVDTATDDPDDDQNKYGTINHILLHGPRCGTTWNSSVSKTTLLNFAEYNITPSAVFIIQLAGSVNPYNGIDYEFKLLYANNTVIAHHSVIYTRYTQNYGVATFNVDNTAISYEVAISAGVSSLEYPGAYFVIVY